MGERRSKQDKAIERERDKGGKRKIRMHGEEKDKERDKERERERQTERDRQRERVRERDTQRET